MVISYMFLRPDGSFVPSVESGKAERQAAKPSAHNQFFPAEESC